MSILHGKCVTYLQSESESQTRVVVPADTDPGSYEFSLLVMLTTEACNVARTVYMDLARPRERLNDHA